MKSFLMFIGGLTIGAGVSWVYHKNKYEQIIQEEVEDLREHYKGTESKGEDERTITKEEIDEEPTEEIDFVEVERERQAEYEEMLHENRYLTEEEEAIVDRNTKPYVVTPDEFASLSGYDTDTFYYHPDNIISNDNQEMVEDVEDILGLTTDEIRDQFGVYEDNAVYIRNTRLKCDYEILLDEGNYIRRNGD